MKFVLVDTSVWLLALRKKEYTIKEKAIIKYLVELIRKGLVMMIGPIRQEVLSGISDFTKFQLLRNNLAAFSDFEISTDDYETAAEYFNLCRSKGIQGSHTDFLICSIAKNNNFSIFTLDKDFELYQKYIDIDLINL